MAVAIADLKLFFEKILEIAGPAHVVSDRSDGVVTRIAKSTGETPMQVVLMLGELAKLKLTYRTYSPSNKSHEQAVVTRVQILKVNFPEMNDGGEPKALVSALVTPTEKKVLAPTHAVSAQGELVRHHAQKTVDAENHLPTNFGLQSGLAAVLVDYDNVTAAARRAGYQISFEKLRDFCRRFGRVIFADIFLSPTASRRQEVISSLWQSGFEVFVCPMWTKDKDAVDEKLKARVRKYAEHSSVSKIVIVSEDRDFSGDPELNQFVKDFGKEIVIVGPSAYRGELEGTDQAVGRLGSSRKVELFKNAINLVVEQTPIANPDDQLKADFAVAVIDEIGRITKPPRQLSYKPIYNFVWASLRDRWQKTFGHDDLKALMQALIDTSVLNPCCARDITFYKLNPSHPVFRQS